MEMVLSNGFCEMDQEEVISTDGGLIILPQYIGYRTGVYLRNLIEYNMQVAEINGYNDTVTSNGRADLVKSYPEKPTW